jgi:Epoxide hydrolase N terminus
MVAYWRDHYDWRQAEATLSRTPQFVAIVEGRTVHFAHLRPDQHTAQRTVGPLARVARYLCHDASAGGRAMIDI